MQETEATMIVSERASRDVVAARRKPLDLFIDVGFFFNVEVAARHVGFGLVVVVIGSEEFHRVVREELLEFCVELSDQGLIVRQHQGGLLHSLDHIGHGVCLAGAGSPQEDLLLVALLDPFQELGNGIRLIASGLKRSLKVELRHFISGQTL